MPPPPRRSHLPLTLSIVAVIIILIIGGLAWMNAAPGGYQGVAAALRMPADLKHAYFVGGDASQAQLYRATWHGLAKVASTTQYQWAGSASPDGSLITGTVRTGTSTLVFVQKPGTADRTYLAEGIAPAFLDAGHVAYFAKGGFVVYNLQAKTGMLVYAMTVQPINATYSPDRTLVAWTDARSGQTVLARISATSYQPVHVFQGVGSMTVTDTGLYAIRSAAKGSELWKYSLSGDAMKVLAFPETLSIRHIIL